jgi:hypothetical protein
MGGYCSAVSTEEQSRGTATASFVTEEVITSAPAKPLPVRAETLVDFTRCTRKDSMACVSGEADQSRDDDDEELDGIDGRTDGWDG